MTLSTEQTNYATAQARYTTLNTQLRTIMSAYPEPEQDGPELDAWIDIEVEVSQKLGITIAFRALLEAEKALIEWGHAIVKSHHLYEGDRAMLEAMFSKLAYHPTFKRKVIGLIMTLDASTVEVQP